jgi:dUTP pyrophosphatase
MRARHDHVLGPREKVKMPLGFSVQPPESTCGMLLPRSGLGAKSDIILANTIGLIDPDYRGELIAVLFNRSNTTPFRISRGDRVCQLAIVPFCSMVAVEAEELSSTERGDSGFGDSGIK